MQPEKQNMNNEAKISDMLNPIIEEWLNVSSSNISARDKLNYQIYQWEACTKRY